MMAKRKLSDEPDRVFVYKPQCSTETEIVNIQIHDLLLLTKQIQSPKFKCGGANLSIGVYPDLFSSIFVDLINHSEEEITASASLKVEAPEMKSEMKKIRIKSYKCGIYLGQEYIKSYETWARENQDLFNLEVKVTVYVHGESDWTMMRSKPKLDFDPIKEVSAMNFNNIQKEFSDFTILSQEGSGFPCHRLILGSQSPPLKAMMTRDTKERREGQVTLPHKEIIVKYFVEYFYSRKVLVSVLEENLESFLSLSEEYDLGPLKLQAEQVAIKELTTENMLEMYLLADLYRAQHLKEASEFLMTRNREVVKQMDLSKYPANTVRDVLCRLF